MNANPVVGLQHTRDKTVKEQGGLRRCNEPHCAGEEQCLSYGVFPALRCSRRRMFALVTCQKSRERNGMEGIESSRINHPPEIVQRKNGEVGRKDNCREWNRGEEKQRADGKARAGSTFNKKSRNLSSTPGEVCTLH